ncbi:protein SINE1-like [Argentina anserina]|uniref:protein SINE1-like n=1 Tax=Argentina anserina TaxID=57926 RepID=UPI00217636D4|nr:protein SINE1-like [Potentilla anserina]XP_050369827.1 protein SINE1-like [Potentilla anserina]
MGRNLAPVVQRELENLHKDADSRRSAMKALKSYVKDLDSKAIPMFLAQVSQSKETGPLNGECTISLYEVLARVHGVKIVPLINSIMATIIKTLASSAGSFPLQQACSKVVPAIARYGIDSTTAEDKKRHIIHSLCNPLADSLLGSQESLTSGAALCLKALVDSDNWRFASDEMVNKVCQNVSGALEEKSTQSNAHMGLVMSLAKRNSIIVEPYARLLIHAGLQILNNGLIEGNSQKRLEAIQMVNFLMKCLDPWSILSELDMVIEEMDKSQSDQMAYVAGAAFEALQTARRIAADKGPKLEKSHSVSGSNFSRRDNSRRQNLSSAGDQSPSSVSPESQTLDSFREYESWVESPVAVGQVSHNSNYDSRSVNRKLWSHERGGVDISLKDGLFSGISHENGYSIAHSDSGNNQFMNNEGECTEELSGFLQRNHRNGVSGSATTSPLGSRTPMDVDNIIFKTPRRLVHSLQDPNNANSDFSEKQTRRFRSLFLEDCSPNGRYNQNVFLHGVTCECNGSFYNGGGEQLQGGPESVSSTDGPKDGDLQAFQNVVPEIKSEIQEPSIRKPLCKAGLKLFCGISFAILAVGVPLTLITDQGPGYEMYLVPT